MLYLKNDLEKELFNVGVQKELAKYDPERRMIKKWRGANGYHSRLADCEVHEYMASFDLVETLLNRDAEGDRAIVYDILYRIIPRQDINPSSKTYGIWAYYLEEDLEQMNPPDWNMADFHTRTLIEVLKDHADKLTDDLKMRVKDAIIHGCRSIIRRNVGPHYTNISVMGAYDTIVAGELLDDKEIFEYGKQRLKILHGYNIANGNFSEFNSPTYTFGCIGDFARMVTDIKDEECRCLAEELNDLAWKTIAYHYHPATGQLAGPHFRAYGALIENGTRFTIARALDHKITIESPEKIRAQGVHPGNFSVNVKCPEKYLSYFTGVYKERIYDDTFAPGRLAYTYMNNVYTLGSLHIGQAWNQHRNVLGYFGSVEKPISVTIRSQHNLWDYCASFMSTVQDKGRALTATTFTSDGCDTHCTLDRIKDNTIKATDMRIRYLFEGAVDDLDVTQDGSTFVITHKESNVKIKICYPYAKFGKFDVRFEVLRRGNTISVDAVLYSGDEIDLHLNELERAGVVSSIEMTDGELSGIDTVTSIENDMMLSTFGNLKVNITEKVLPSHVDQFNTLYLERDGVEYKPAF